MWNSPLSPTPDGDDHLSRVLRGRLGATFVGHDPSIQLLSVDDMGRALSVIVGFDQGTQAKAALTDAIRALLGRYEDDRP